MCGILVNIGDLEIGDHDPGLDIIEHRGPDAFGTANFATDNLRISLGHRRLSIIDLSERGKQPMSYSDRRFWLTYNGEIYNYLEIRDTLIKEGYSFQSDSDTEVLLASYVRWGKECLHRFNGMFSFCIYDQQERKVFLARDRYGIKPLYYYNGKSNFRACSEIKQITTLEEFTPKMNGLQVYHFLNSGDFSFSEETMWQDVYEVQPGHSLELDLTSWRPGDAINCHKWYDPVRETDQSISFEDACCEFRRLLEQSVKFRLRADVPLGFLLSGGLDSSTLVGLAHEKMESQDANLKVYSSCYENSPIDEREYIQAMIGHTHADACLHFPKPADIVDSFDNVIWHNDIPVLHGSPVPHSLIYRHIKGENDARIVILEGQGADEILCGYGDFYWAYLYELFKISRLPEFIRQYRVFQRIHHEPLKIAIRKWRRLRNPQSVKYPSNPVLNTSPLLHDLSIPQRAVLREEPSVYQLHLNRLTILRYILHNVDRNSMSQSRETRVPYLDHNLVEFCLKLPSSYKIYDGLSKRILRKSVKDVLPEKIKNRVDKQGYSSPVPMWAGEDLLSFFEKEIRATADLPFVNADKVLEGFRTFCEKRTYFDPVFWRLIAVNHWINMFSISAS